MEKVTVEDVECFSETSDRSCILLWDDLQRKVYLPHSGQRKLQANVVKAGNLFSGFLS